MLKTDLSKSKSSQRWHLLCRASQRFPFFPCLLGPPPSPAMFEQGPQTISTAPGPSPFGCQSPSQADGSRTRKDGFQVALPFGSSLCAGPLGMAAWRGGCGIPDSRHRCYPGRAASRHGSLYSWSMRVGAWTGFPGVSILSHKRLSGS